MFLNFMSIKRVVARFQIVATIAKVASTLFIVVVGLYFLVVHERVEHLQRPFEGSTYGVSSLAAALFAGLFAYDGWGVINTGIEEVKNPRR